MYDMPHMFDGMAPSLFPTVDTAVHGLEQAKYGKEPFKVTGYNVKVFDMSKEADRDEYCKLMERLVPMCQNAQCVVSKNELQVLNGAGWWRYVEWFEYKLNDKTADSGKGGSDPAEDSSDSAVDEHDNNDDGIW